MRAGGGVGIGILAERVRMVFKPPPGAGGGSERSDGPTRAPKREGRGRTARAGGGVGNGLPVCTWRRKKADATRPLFARHEQKGGSGADAERRGTIIIL